ncbi:MAG TPA: alpha/beta hydrolase [Cellvibrio sp.]|nr:alpha/beta hydrolase [Cellvibrio sp.]
MKNLLSFATNPLIKEQKMKGPNIIRFSLLLILIFSLMSCSNNRHLKASEKALETDGSITMRFHSALYYPAELSMRFDGYIVGVEKSPRKTLLNDGDLNTVAIPAAGFKDKEDVEEILNDGKLLYVSHVIKNFREPEEKNCALYNLYSGIDPETSPLVNECTDEVLENTSTESEGNNKPFKKSWSALDKLSESMSNRIKKGKYTHIVVVTMGWNTPQEEAIRNFNSIIYKLREEHESSIKPLVIGVTWPSEWTYPLLDPLVRILSFPNKARDADELGLTWLGVLLHDTIPRANSGRLPVIVIGHSFGSRASSVAACVGPGIYNTVPIKPQHTDTVVNLQGAFLSRRLFGENDQGFHFPESCKTVKNFVLTSSKGDDAVRTAIWSMFGGYYAGDSRSYKDICTVEAPKVRCVKAGSDGKMTLNGTNNQKNITLINADDLISENAYNTGGGAHSDIFRSQHGRLLRDIINRDFNGTTVK